MSTLKRSTLIVTLILLTACSAMPTSTLALNRQKWQSQNIAHYRFQLNVGCFCAFRSQMPLTIEVRDGQIVSMLNSEGQPIPADLVEILARYNTIDKIFAMVESAIHDGADKVTISYNDDYGYIESANIDYIETAMDDELSLIVNKFEILQ